MDEDEIVLTRTHRALMEGIIRVDDRQERRQAMGRRALMATFVLLLVGIGAGIALNSEFVQSTTTAPVETTADSSTTTWRNLRSNLHGDDEAVVAWTGQEVLIVHPVNDGEMVVGEAWSPETEAVRTIAAPGLIWRARAATAWTGSELILIGGSNGPGLDQIGMAYDPATDRWRDLADPPGPFDGAKELLGPAVWSGSEVIIPGAGLAYDVDSDSWRQIAASPLSKRDHSLIGFAGERLVIWGGCYSEIGDCGDSERGLLSDGALYDPVEDRWELLPPAPLDPSAEAQGVTNGETDLVVVSFNSRGQSMEAAVLDASQAEWTTLPAPELSARPGFATALVDERLLVWGGRGGYPTGAILDLSSGTWSPLEPAPVEQGRTRPKLVALDGAVYISATDSDPTPLLLQLGTG
jgi:hypothetical protein